MTDFIEGAFFKDFFSKCDQIRRKPRIWSRLLKKSLMENFIFSAAYTHIMKRTITKIEQTPLFLFKIDSQESSVPVEDDLLEEEASEEVDDEIAATSSQVQVIPNQEVSRVSKHFKNKLARY